MKLMHISDVHLGVKPDAGKAWSEKRAQDIWDSFAEMIEIAAEESPDFLLISGDLFHKQPLKRELKEVCGLFARIPQTKVLLMAGNHDYIQQNSFYRTCEWPENVCFFPREEVMCFDFPEQNTTVYGLSYWHREIRQALYDEVFPKNTDRINILLAHGGDERHIPFSVEKILRHGFDYMAAGHIHKGGQLVQGRAVMAGALEPTDCNDTGAHGYWIGDIGKTYCEVSFYPVRKCEYCHEAVEVTPGTTGYDVTQQIKELLAERPAYQYFRICLQGYKDPDVIFDLNKLSNLERIVDVTEQLRPDYDYDKLLAEHENSLLGAYIAAMQKNRVSAECFNISSGYGYNDMGRDTLERVYADCFGGEDALVRPQITCGTHALALALMSNLRPGDELLSPVGKPYDTLEEVIGIRPSKGSLAEYGITYAQVDLLPDGEFDYDGIKKAINEKTKLVTIQRSKGYATRPTLSVKRIGELIAFVKSIKPDVICMVDNCYGEFVEDTEPIQVGADMMVGSLIKNPGGGLAPIGGYIVGKKECVENAAYRLTSPGLGKEVGASLGVIQSFYQGFFLAPTVVSGALKGAIFAAKIYEKLGFKVVPDGTESRHDIIQAVEFNNRDAMIAFCEGIQAAAPVDSYVTPEPWAMPGYDSDVIMAAGAFVQGSSIELSADGPVKPPYAVYFQGGLTWYHAKLGILMSLQKLYERNLVKLD